MLPFCSIQPRRLGLVMLCYAMLLCDACVLPVHPRPYPRSTSAHVCPRSPTFVRPGRLVRPLTLAGNVVRRLWTQVKRKINTHLGHWEVVLADSTLPFLFCLLCTTTEVFGSGRQDIKDLSLIPRGRINLQTTSEADGKRPRVWKTAARADANVVYHYFGDA